MGKNKIYNIMAYYVLAIFVITFIVIFFVLFFNNTLQNHEYFIPRSIPTGSIMTDWQGIRLVKSNTNTKNWIYPPIALGSHSYIVSKYFN